MLNLFKSTMKLSQIFSSKESIESQQQSNLLDEENRIARIEKMKKEQASIQIKRVTESSLVDKDWYLTFYSDLTGSDVCPIEHYVLFGWKEGRNPNAYFDTNWFINEYQLESNVCPLLHYIDNWRAKALIPSPKFDSINYIENHKDIKEAGIEPLSHYLGYGVYEGRQYRSLIDYIDEAYTEYEQTNLFLPDWYAIVNEDLRDSGVNAIEHFALYGQFELRNPNPYFDLKWYTKKYAEEIGDNESVFLFYANQGWKLGHSPSPKFDATRYSKEYLKDKTQEPLSHFLTEGKKRGLRAFDKNALEVSSGGALRFDPEAVLTKDAPLRALIDNIPTKLSPAGNYYSNVLNIHWVMPDFSPGAGGHMTIFRTIRYLETFGHTNTIWIYNPTLHESEEAAYQDIIQHFQLVKAEVKFTSDPTFISASGDVVFATDWGSVSFVNSMAAFKRRFYFVQDHEPEFYAQGSYAISARNTYKHDLDCVCASPWLKQLMENKYGRWAREFWLSVDFNTYRLPEVERENGDVVKIAFYARHFTSRRAVELGFLALEALAEKGLNIEVHSFGAPLPFNSAPFKCIDHGICDTEQLAKLYQTCDLGVVFSATNYSLIPQEMMACGIPVAELDVESTRAIFPEGVVSYLSTEPREMAEQLAELVENDEKRKHQAQIAYEWVSQFTWEDAAKAVEQAILERLPQLGFEYKETEKNKGIKASVIIPTWNAGDIFKKVIKRLQEQKAPWEYEVLVVDSGSKDDTVEFIKNNPDINLHVIPNSEFQHGRTRNLAISLTKGEYVAVLTQDALPVDEYWLYNMVTALEHYPDAAGVFGKHFAWPDADPYTKRDLVSHFENFENFPYCVSQSTDSTKWKNKDLGWRQFLHFYSDNNSMMRKSVWETLPYPEVPFGEDQAWAWEIIKAGYQKVYCKQGAVFHSHDFDEGNVEKRAFEEAEFFRDVFGYTMIDSDKVDDEIVRLNAFDKEWGVQNSLTKEMIKRRIASNSARLTGFNKANLNGN